MKNTVLLLLLFPQLLLAQGKLEQVMIRQGLVDIQKVDPAVLVELKYSTTDNFVGKDVYGDLTRAYLQPLAAQKLAKASRELQHRRPDLRLLVYDATRPRSAQWALWNTLKHLPVNERGKYVSNPRNGSVHNYGCAVDLTLATKDGKPLDMGTPFDYFGELAHPEKEDQLLKQGKLRPKQVENRRLLRAVMKKAGFSSLKAEWWHFNALSRAEAKKQYKIVE
ncbi:M15 family metallopeptidase [Larkinella ripae]